MGGTPIHELRGLTERYGSVEALRGLEATACAGEVFGFLGRNGAGKSTAIRAVMGITRPTEGALRLFGEEVTRRTHVALRQWVGYVAQDQTFYPSMTPRTLVRFVRGFFPTWDNAGYAQLLGIAIMNALWERPGVYVTSVLGNGRCGWRARRNHHGAGTQEAHRRPHGAAVPLLRSPSS